MSDFDGTNRINPEAEYEITHIRSLVFSREYAEQKKQELKNAAPEKETKMTMRQFIHDMYPTIREATERGFTIKEIYGKLLSEQHQKVAYYSTFAAYIRREEKQERDEKLAAEEAERKRLAMEKKAEIERKKSEDGQAKNVETKNKYSNKKCENLKDVDMLKEAENAMMASSPKSNDEDEDDIPKKIDFKRKSGASK